MNEDAYLTAQEHLDKAEHNEAFVLELEPHRNGYPDWAITALFYSALHYVSAYLRNCGIRVVTHQERENAINRGTFRRTISRPYKRLKARGLLARYGNYKFSSAEVHDVFKHLDAIKRYATKKLIH